MPNTNYDRPIFFDTHVADDRVRGRRYHNIPATPLYDYGGGDIDMYTIYTSEHYHRGIQVFTIQRPREWIIGMPNKPFKLIIYLKVSWENTVTIVISNILEKQVTYIRDFINDNRPIFIGMKPDHVKGLCTGLARQAEIQDQASRHPVYNVSGRTKAAISAAYNEHKKNKWNIVKKVDMIEALFTDLKRTGYLEDCEQGGNMGPTGLIYK